MLRNLSVSIAALMIISLGITACSQKPAGTPGDDRSGAKDDVIAVAVADAWARPGQQGEHSAVYLVINNQGTVDDSLVRAVSTVGTAELHESVERDNVVAMEHRDRINVPAGTSVTLAPGGLHIMLMDLQVDLTVDNTFIVKLTFAEAGEQEVLVTVNGSDGATDGGDVGATADDSDDADADADASHADN